MLGGEPAQMRGLPRVTEGEQARAILEPFAGLCRA
jgi:hypothetical protein